MIKKISFCCLLVVNCFSQNINQIQIDSLVKILSLNTTNKIKTHCAIANLYYYSNPSEGLKHANKALEYAKKTKNNPDLGLVYGMLAINLNRLGEINNALDAIEKSIQFTIKSKDDIELSKRYITKANILLKKTEYQQCIEFYLLAEKITLKEKQPLFSNLMAIYSNIGIAFQELDNYDKAEYYYKKGLKIAIETNNENNEILYNINISTIYLERDINSKKVLELLLPLEDKAIKSGRNGTLITLYNNISAAYSQQQDFINANFYLSKELPYIASLNDPEKKANYYLTKAENNIDGLLINPSNKKNNAIIEDALADLYSAKEIYTQLKRKNKLSIIEKKKSILYEFQDNFKQAMQAIKNFVAYQDSLFSEQKVEERTKTIFNFQFEKKADSLKLIQLINKQKFQQKEHLNQLLLKQQKAILNLKQAALNISNQKLIIEYKNKENQNLQFKKMKNESNLKITFLKKQTEFQTQLSKAINRQKVFLITGIILLLLIITLLYFQVKLKQRNFIKLNNLNEQLKQSNDSKLNIINVINHDFRAPIANLIHFLDIKNDRFIDSKSKLEIAEISKNKISKLLIAMDDFLIWGKSQLNNFSPIIEQISIQDIFNECKYYFSTYQHATIQYYEKSTNYISIDKEIVKIIIRNLTLNAIEANNNSNKLIINWLFEENENYYFIIISDNGCGFKDGLNSNIFEQNNSLNRKKGMGLTLIKEFIEKLNWEISVINNNGTKFTIKIKKADSIEPAF